MEILIILGIILILYIIFYIKYVKSPKLKNITYIDGGLGTGKSAVSLIWAIKKTKIKQLFWKIKKILLNVFHKEPKNPKPMLYVNIPIANFEYIPITKELLLRQKRPIPKSVFWIDEMSLVADQTLNPTKQANKEYCDTMSAFFKLFRHWSHNGHLIFNCQSTSQLNYTIKECISDYFYIHSKIRLIWHSIIKVQERVYSRDNDGVLQVNDGDIEDKLKIFIIRNKVFKQYDNIAYSILTDHKEMVTGPVKKIERKPFKKVDLKAREIISLAPNTQILKEMQELKERENERK